MRDLCPPSDVGGDIGFWGIVLVEFHLLLGSRAGGGGLGGRLSGLAGFGMFTGLGTFDFGGVRFVQHLASWKDVE